MVKLYEQDIEQVIPSSFLRNISDFSLIEVYITREIESNVPDNLDPWDPYLEVLFELRERYDKN